MNFNKKNFSKFRTFMKKLYISVFRKEAFVTVNCSMKILFLRKNPELMETLNNNNENSDFFVSYECEHFFKQTFYIKNLSYFKINNKISEIETHAKNRVLTNYNDVLKDVFKNNFFRDGFFDSIRVKLKPTCEFKKLNLNKDQTFGFIFYEPKYEYKFLILNPSFKTKIFKTDN